MADRSGHQRKTARRPQSKERSGGWAAEKRSRRPFIIAACLLLAVLVVIGFAFWAAANHRAQAANALAENEAARAGVAAPAPESIVEAPRDLPETLGEILRWHSDVTGLEPVNSLSLSGRYETAGQQFNLLMVNQAPNRVRQQLNLARYEMVALYDGEFSTLREVSPQTGERSAPLDPLNHTLLLLETHLGALAWQYRSGGARGFKLDGETAVDGIDCWVIENSTLCPQPVLHVVSKVTGLELERRTRLSTDAGAQELVVRFDESTLTAGGVMLPKRYVLRIDGEVASSATFDSLVPNAGILPSVFSNPGQ